MIVNGTDILYMDTIDGNYINSFEATITDIRTDEKDRPYLVLDRTAFYPEGGGQPTDTGSLTFHPDGGPDRLLLTVVRVTKKSDIRHYISEVDQLSQIPSGSSVVCELDWEKRHAHMKMHTAQHMVSSIVYDLYGAATVGNQIHSETSRIDFAPLSHDEVDVSLIETRCNDLIRVNPPVLVMFQDRSEIEDSQNAERCNVHLIPQSVRELRIVKIQDVELCPCAGTHIRALGEIGGIRILFVRSKGKGKVRITYELI